MSLKEEDQVVSVCSIKELPPRPLEKDINPDRQRLIQVLDVKWVNGTTLNYYMYDSGQWEGPDSQKDAVRKAFETWKDCGIGLKFEEVDDPQDAEIRIGFEQGAGSWSYLGNQILQIPKTQRTMNIGWDISADIDTAIHEIGHTLGFPHEHQNPNAGIVWDEEAVYTWLGGPPNNWSREQTFHNIIRKIDPDTVQGSEWDANSIMHYPFNSGMIKSPEEYVDSPLIPAGGLSERDQKWVKTFYPPIDDEEEKMIELKAFKSEELDIGPGEQVSFKIKPKLNRKYTISTFGISDTVLSLYEDDELIEEDNDAGWHKNAKIRLRLKKKREYVLKVRLFWSDGDGRTAVMMW